MSTVLVLTERFDPTADEVIDVLNRRGVPLVRVDLNEIEVAAQMDGDRWVGQLSSPTHRARLEDLSGIYYRRPSSPAAGADVPSELAEWAQAEIRWGLRGLLVALPRDRWINWPPGIHAAEHKPWQLAEAAAAGLDVPATIVTNLPEAAAEFAADAAPVVYKSFRGQAVEVDGQQRLVFTTPVTADDCLHDGIRVAPIMLQANVDKAYDVRATYVDGEIFAISPRWAGGEIPLDWRIDHTANTWYRVEVPAQVRARLTAMMEGMRLRYAACDFTVDHYGRWYFLDLNPAGQWAWTSPVRDAIAEALADALIKESPQ